MRYRNVTFFIYYEYDIMETRATKYKKNRRKTKQPHTIYRVTSYMYLRLLALST